MVTNICCCGFFVRLFVFVVKIIEFPVELSLKIFLSSFFFQQIRLVIKYLSYLFIFNLKVNVKVVRSERFECYIFPSIVYIGLSLSMQRETSNIFGFNQSSGIYVISSSFGCLLICLRHLFIKLLRELIMRVDQLAVIHICGQLP